MGPPICEAGGFVTILERVMLVRLETGGLERVATCPAFSDPVPFFFLPQYLATTYAPCSPKGSDRRARVVGASWIERLTRKALTRKANAAMKEKARTVRHWLHPEYAMSAGPVTKKGARHHPPQ